MLILSLWYSLSSLLLSKMLAYAILSSNSRLLYTTMSHYNQGDKFNFPSEYIVASWFKMQFPQWYLLVQGSH